MRKILIEKKKKKKTWNKIVALACDTFSNERNFERTWFSAIICSNERGKLIASWNRANYRRNRLQETFRSRRVLLLEARQVKEGWSNSVELQRRGTTRGEFGAVHAGSQEAVKTYEEPRGDIRGRISTRSRSASL